MPRRGGLLGRFTRFFWLQILLITLAALLGVFGAKIVIEEILLKNAVLEEAGFFWQRHAADPASALPDTKNLTGFFDPGDLPPVIRDRLPTEPGFYEYDDLGTPLVLHLSRRDGQTLYLLYYRGQVDALIVYYGIFPLLTVLTILYLALWLAYRFAHRSISPIVRLANRIDRIDFARDELAPNLIDAATERDDEIQTLADALSHLGERLQAFIARERNFTRDASHELRSPLTVINVAADMLLLDNELPPRAQQSLLKIKRAVYDMENLTEVFLMLAREHAGALTEREVDVNRVMREQIERNEFLGENKPIRVCLEERESLRVFTSETVVAVLLGNLLRNAMLYTERGDVRVEIGADVVTISDSGPGIAAEDLGRIFEPFNRGGHDNASGHGIGLTIVKRLCDRFGWSIEVRSESGIGTSFDVAFGPA